MRPPRSHDEVKTRPARSRRRRLPGRRQVGLHPAGVWPRYLVVNGDESEPGTYKDRLLMERDPHQLIEGCLIACYALGLSQCFLYVRGEMALAQERVAAHSTRPTQAGYIGKNILGTDFSVDIVLHWGAGAYIVGEETALIEIARGRARHAPAQAAVLPGRGRVCTAKPTIVNNVETLSNLPWIVCQRRGRLHAIGTETSPGTRMFAVSGHVKRPGVYEIADGSRRSATSSTASASPGHPRRQRAQGVRARRWLGAVVRRRATRHPVRGPCRRQAGSMLGSGAVVVMDDTTDIVAAPARWSSSSPTSRAASARRAARAPPG